VGTQEHAARVADALRREPGIEVEVVNGKGGELTVQVDGKTVAKKFLFLFKPSVEQVVQAVREAAPAEAHS
jgi:hypothetical protein